MKYRTIKLSVLITGFVVLHSQTKAQNVGIGLNNPTVKLQVSEGVKSDHVILGNNMMTSTDFYPSNGAEVYIRESGLSGDENMIVFDKTGGVAFGMGVSDLGPPYDVSELALQIKFVGGASYNYNTGTGDNALQNEVFMHFARDSRKRIGVWTTEPSTEFDVNGQIRMRSGATTGYVIQGDANGVMSWADPSALFNTDGEWHISGNAGTNPSTQFLGTTDLKDLVFRTNNAERMRLMADGALGLGIAAPGAKLHILSNNSTSATNIFSLENPVRKLMDVRDDGIVAINQGAAILGASSFIVNDRDATGYGGMYVNVDNAAGQPFYGYSNNGTPLAWSYVDGGDANKLKWYNGGVKMTLTNNGRLGVGTENPIANLELESSDASAMYNFYNEMNLVSTTATRYGAYTIVNKGSTGNNLPAYGNYSLVLNNDAGNTYGVYGYANGSASNNKYGVYGRAVSGAGAFSYGVYGFSSGAGFNYSMYCSGNGVYTGTWSTISDRKFKENIEDYSGALDQIMALSPKTYTYKRDAAYSHMNLAKGNQIGFIAQEVAEIIPELVEEGGHPGIEDDPSGKISEPIRFKSMNYIGMIPVTVQAIREQQEMIQALKKENNSLKARIEAIEAKLNK